MKILKEFNFGDAGCVNTKLKERIREISARYTNGRREERKACVGCGEVGYSYAFEKMGFHYVQCTNCSSLYVKNPLGEVRFAEYKKEVLRLYKEKRFVEIFQNLYEKKLFDFEVSLNRLFDKKEKNRIGFVGLKYSGFMSELKKKFPRFLFEELVLGSRKKYNLVVLDNIIETLLDPEKLLNELKTRIADLGYIYISSRLGSGIDILMLWEDSSILPTEHLNLFSREGIEFLVDRFFTIKHLSTPGVLDVRLMLESSRDKLPPFLKYLRKHRGPEIVEDFQLFVQKNLLSSYLVLLAQKK